MNKIKLIKKVVIYSFLCLVTIISLSISFNYLKADQKTEINKSDKIPDIFKPFNLDTKIDEINKYYKDYKIIEVDRSISDELIDITFKNWKIMGDAVIRIIYSDKKNTKIKKIFLNASDLREECVNCVSYILEKNKNSNDKLFSLCREKNYAENLKLFNAIYKIIEKQYGKNKKTYQIEYYDGLQPDLREKSSLWERDKFDVYLILKKIIHEGCWSGWEVYLGLEIK
jgi:hypothetical protein